MPVIFHFHCPVELLVVPCMCRGLLPQWPYHPISACATHACLFRPARMQTDPQLRACLLAALVCVYLLGIYLLGS